MDKNFQAPVFVVGMPRSGTTLISNLLNASSDIYIGPETHFYNIYANWINSNSNISFYRFFSKTKFFSYFNFTAQESLDLELLLKTANSRSSYISIFCSFLSNNRNISRWGEKTPDHYDFLDLILKDFPNCYIVGIVRDPRDVYLSLLNVEWGKFYHNPWYFCREYKKAIKSYSKFPDSILVIRYEDVLLKKDSLFSVFDTLNLSFSDNIYNFFNNSEFLNFDEKKEPWKKNNFNKIESNNFNKWLNSDVDPQIFRYLSYKLKKEIKLFDYLKGNYLSIINCSFLEFKFLVLYFVLYLKSVFKIQ